MPIKYRVIIVISVAFVIAMGLLGIRDFFDSSDKNAALQILEHKGHYREMANQLAVPKDQVFCTTYLVSRYEGRVLVECGLKKAYKTEGWIPKWRWLVDINQKTIQTVNP